MVNVYTSYNGGTDFGSNDGPEAPSGSGQSCWKY